MTQQPSVDARVRTAALAGANLAQHRVPPGHQGRDVQHQVRHQRPQHDGLQRAQLGHERPARVAAGERHLRRVRRRGELLRHAIRDLSPIAQLAVADPTMRGRGVFRLARGQCDHALAGRCVEILRVSGDDLGVLRSDDLVCRVLVHVPVVLGTHDDRVALLQQVDGSQRSTVAVAVAGDREIAD